MSLLSLVVALIVLLILSGTVIAIGNYLIMNRVVSVSAKTAEASLQEKIKMAWLEAETSYYNELENLSNVDKTSYVKQKLVEILKNSYNFGDIVILGDGKEENDLSIRFENEDFEFIISPDGTVNVGKPEEIAPEKLLKGNVKIGDYIEYPVEYVDVYSQEKYTASNGWRVIDDGVMEGTSGDVKIISTGIPAKWFHDTVKYENNQIATEALLYDFENVDLYSRTGEKIEPNCFKVKDLASKITTLTLSDLNTACNALYQTTRTSDDVSLFDDTYHLFRLDSSITYYYWLATVKEGTEDKMFYISDRGIQDELKSRMGIRPVIYLKSKLSGEFENNVWKITK